MLQSRTTAGRVLRKVFPLASDNLAEESAAALAAALGSARSRVGRSGTITAQMSGRTNTWGRKQPKTAKSLKFRAAGNTQSRQPYQQAVV